MHSFQRQNAAPLEVSVADGRFLFNSRPINPGSRCAGLLMNSRMVQATFDDLNPQTRGQWAHPDGTPFDAEQNTRRFCAMVPTYADHGLNAVTLNLQGGSPQGYSKEQPWHNSAFTSDGELQPAYMQRTASALDACAASGMAVILGLFYFGQDQRVNDEAAVCRGVDNVVDWLLARGDRHVLLEIANECDLAGKYDHDILKSDPGGATLIRRAQQRANGRLLVSTSFAGGKIPTPTIVEAADFILIHGNGVHEPDKLRRQIADTRAVAGYRGQPVVINEDDHYDFEKPDHNMHAAIEAGVGWGFFDYRRAGEPFAAGYQSVPVDWDMNHERKAAFFGKLKEVTSPT